MRTRTIGMMALLGLLSFTMFLGVAARPAAASSCPAGDYCGTAYYTLFSPGTAGVFSFTYIPGTSFSFSSGPTVIAGSLPHGADGIIVNPQNPNDLLVGSNDNTNNFYDITTGGTVTVHSLGASGVFPYNLMADTAGTTLYGDSDAGQPTIVSLPLTPSIGTGTTITFTAGSTDTYINTIAFVGGTAYYTADLTRFTGIDGHVGIITFSGTTATTSCFKDTVGDCATYFGVHGLSYDPYSGNLMVFGSDEINEISTSGNLVAHETVTTPSGLAFDQGSADGFGHLLISSNNGYLFFEDYTGTTIGHPGNFEYYTSVGGAFANMDDLAPLVGPGAPPITGVPEFPFGVLALFLVAVPAVLLLRGVRRRGASSPAMP